MKLAVLYDSRSGNTQRAAEWIALGMGEVEGVEARAYQIGQEDADFVKEARGLALDSISDTTDVLERDTVVFPKFHREKCIGCGRCVISCADGGHQAIRLDEDRRPILDGKKCVGCHLCVLVCPQRAISSSRKRISRSRKDS